MESTVKGSNFQIIQRHGDDLDKLSKMPVSSVLLSPDAALNCVDLWWYESMIVFTGFAIGAAHMYFSISGF